MKKVIVLFEVTLKTDQVEDYLKAAALLKEELVHVEGFIGAERFSSLATGGKLLSKSEWKDEESVMKWRNQLSHRRFQEQGRLTGFIDYKITVVTPIRCYTMNSREKAPADSNLCFNL